MDYLISKNDCSNLDELITLSKSYYTSGDIIDKNYLIWQYLDNPAGTPFLFTSREKSAISLAGQYLVLPQNYQVLGDIVSGSLSLNTLTHPDHQGKGLFTKMANSTYVDCSENDNYFTIGFPNPLSYPGFVRKLDFTHLGDIPLLIKPLKPLNICMSFFQKNKEKHGGEIVFQSAQSNEIIREFNFSSDEDQKKYEHFWEKMKVNYPVSSNKDFQFLKWRYNDHPTKKYKVYSLYKDDEIIGIVILRAEHVWGFNVGIIMDFMQLNFTDKTLLKFVSKSFKNMKLDFIAVLHSEIWEYKVFKKNYYFKVPQKILPQKIHFIVRNNKSFDNAGKILDLKNWKLTFGDYDIF